MSLSVIIFLELKFTFSLFLCLYRTLITFTVYVALNTGLRRRAYSHVQSVTPDNNLNNISNYKKSACTSQRTKLFSCTKAICTLFYGGNCWYRVNPAEYITTLCIEFSKLTHLVPRLTNVH